MVSAECLLLIAVLGSIVGWVLAEIENRRCWKKIDQLEESVRSCNRDLDASEWHLRGEEDLCRSVTRNRDQLQEKIDEIRDIIQRR